MYYLISPWRAAIARNAATSVARSAIRLPGLRTANGETIEARIASVIMRIGNTRVVPRLAIYESRC